MSKSPLNILGELAAGALAGKGKGKGIRNRLKVIERKLDNISKNMPRGSRPGIMDSETTAIGPGTNMPGAVVNESPDILGAPVNDTGVVAGGSFDPSTLSTAENIFGKPMEDSFDRNLGVAGGEADSAIGLDTEEDTNELV